MQEKCKLFKFVLLFEAFIGYASIASVEVFRKKNVNIVRFYATFMIV